MKKHEFYLVDTKDDRINWEKFRYIIRHKGCFVAGDKNRDWGTYGNTCTGCGKPIPEYLVLQRNLLSGHKGAFN